MKKVPLIKTRKAEHLDINLKQDVRSGISTGLDEIGLIHQALPEIALDQVNTQLTLFERKLSAPVIISSMTGGTPQAGSLNLTLAKAAQACGIGMALGSYRVALDHPEVAPSYQVRKVAPDILLFANLGAVQLNYGYTIAHCLRTVEECNADALILHLNPLQEALQPEGDSNFSDLVGKIEQVCRKMPVPVVAKEVGWGISIESAKKLVNAGVAAIEVAGAGGTSWSQVERYRSRDAKLAGIASAFRNWGIPTTQAIRLLCQALPRTIIVASGGLKDGVDIAKCIALGATAGSMAAPFLKVAAQSLKITIQSIEVIKQQLKIAMFAAGAVNLKALSKTGTIVVQPINNHG